MREQGTKRSSRTGGEEGEARSVGSDRGGRTASVTTCIPRRRLLLSSAAVVQASARSEQEARPNGWKRGPGPLSPPSRRDRRPRSAQRKKGRHRPLPPLQTALDGRSGIQRPAWPSPSHTASSRSVTETKALSSTPPRKKGSGRCFMAERSRITSYPFQPRLRPRPARNRRKGAHTPSTSLPPVLLGRPWGTSEGTRMEGWNQDGSSLGEEVVWRRSWPCPFGQPRGGARDDRGGVLCLFFSFSFLTFFPLV